VHDSAVASIKPCRLSARPTRAASAAGVALREEDGAGIFRNAACVPWMFVKTERVGGADQA